MGGFRRGLIKEVILLGGLVISVVISFMLRVPISTFFYKTLPFFSFGGLFKGVTIINILLYEVIAFLIVFSISYLVLRILLKISGIIEKILKATKGFASIAKKMGREILPVGIIRKANNNRFFKKEDFYINIGKPISTEGTVDEIYDAWCKAIAALTDLQYIPC